MKKIFILSIIVIIILIGLYLLWSNNFRLNIVNPMEYKEIVKNLSNNEYKGLNKYFVIQYDKPIIEKTVEDGKEKNILSYNINFKNTANKKLNLNVTFYYENEEFVKSFYSYDLDKINNIKFLGGKYIEVDVGKTYETTLSLDITDPETYEDDKKEYFYNNYGKFICYCIVEDTESKSSSEYIEIIDVTK